MRNTSEITPFGRRVKIRLLELDMDAKELAEQVGTSPVQISRILHGKRPGRKQIPKIAKVLGLKLPPEDEAM
ncbi:MAG: helix-turn-helix transcriptional regulator [Clostridia bacterium]|nr:helix-turn-helix transcriptional regulator [Clostridia bacterium]